MQNTIPRRIFDFLKDMPPFTLMDAGRLMRISEQVVVQYKKNGEIIFRQGDEPGTFFYIVHEGAVQLLSQAEGEEDVLIEECDEGDLFGIRPLLAEEPYALTAQAKEECLLYAIRTSDFRQIVEHNPKVALYLASTFAAEARPKAIRTGRENSAFPGMEEIGGQSSLVEIQCIERSKQPITCSPATTIQEAARIMSEKEVGSIVVVDEELLPLGIVTDKDFRKKVVTGKYDLVESVQRIMSSPVITARSDLSIADVQIKMIRHKINHLCLTENGEDNTPVIGVISEHDLMVLQGNNPAILIREMKRSRDVRQLKGIRLRAEELLDKYLDQEVSISYITGIMSEINDALIVRSIELAVSALEAAGKLAPQVDFCWLALGSEGRREQLLRTDQDNALVFSDVPESEYEQVKAYFLDLAVRTTEILNECGFDYCPADMMASNPRWCLSLKEWKAQFSKWIHSPTPKAVLHSTIFFDFRPVYGTFSLAERLTEHIFLELDRQSLFMTYLAKNAVGKPPPLTFFRNFVVEKGGEHKDEFDIKARAMMPLTDAARVLILHARKGKINNTFRRFEELAASDPNNKELFEQAADAYEILMRYRAQQGLKNKDTGRYINPTDLTKMERLNLRNSFKPIRELQTLIATRFQVLYVR
jgi:CBS domain-containing protein